MVSVDYDLILLRFTLFLLWQMVLAVQGEEGYLLLAVLHQHLETWLMKPRGRWRPNAHLLLPASQGLLPSIQVVPSQ